MDNRDLTVVVSKVEAVAVMPNYENNIKLISLSDGAAEFDARFLGTAVCGRHPSDDDPPESSHSRPRIAAL